MRVFSNLSLFTPTAAIRYASLCAIMSLPCAGAYAQSQTVFLGSIKDATIYENNTENSFGVGDILAGQTTISGTSPSLTRRGLLTFDLSGIPDDATIDSVSLTLHVLKESPRVGSASPTDTFHLHRLLADWGESTNDGANFPGDPPGQGQPANPGDATWLSNAHDSSTWTTPGGDIEAAASASQIAGPLVGVGAPVSVVWSGDGLVSDVQAWLDGTADNFGWALIGDPSLTERTARRFGSRENINAALRPTLTVEFTPVPEPSSLVLLSGAGLLALRRRRSA